MTLRTHKTYLVVRWQYDTWRAAADPAKPIALERWAPNPMFANSPLSAPVPAWTFYRFEVFKQGNNSGVADSTFTTAIIAPVPLASAGRTFKWAQFDAATRALAATGPAVAAPTVAFTVPTGGLAPTSAAVFGRPASTGPRTISSAQVPFGSTSLAVPTESPARAGCGTGPVLPELGGTGFGFRGLSVFRQAPDTTFHDNGIQWNNWQ
jgi:hypothetical protein